MQGDCQSEEEAGWHLCSGPRRLLQGEQGLLQARVGFFIRFKSIKKKVSIHCREALKDHDVVFIVLNLTQGCQEQRLEKRQGGGGRTGALKKMYSLYEPAGEGERHSYNITISENTTPGDVVKEVLEIIAKI